MKYDFYLSVAMKSCGRLSIIWDVFWVDHVCNQNNCINGKTNKLYNRVNSGGVIENRHGC